MATMPIYGKKHSNYFFSKTTLLILQEAYGAPTYKKKTKIIPVGS